MMSNLKKCLVTGRDLKPDGEYEKIIDSVTKASHTLFPVADKPIEYSSKKQLLLINTTFYGIKKPAQGWSL